MAFSHAGVIYYGGAPNSKIELGLEFVFAETNKTD